MSAWNYLNKGHNRRHTQRSKFNFRAASVEEKYVYGAMGPGNSDNGVYRWVKLMQQQGIKRVCCLLNSELHSYESDLLASYRHQFGEEALLWVPFNDYDLTNDSEVLLIEEVLPFLADSVSKKEPVVVHCVAGSSRTGIVLAAWLVYGWSMTNQQALETVLNLGGNPVVAGGKPQLNSLLNACRVAANS